jgi:hypothetical protein
VNERQRPDGDRRRIRWLAVPPRRSDTDRTFDTELGPHWDGVGGGLSSDILAKMDEQLERERVRELSAEERRAPTERSDPDVDIDLDLGCGRCATGLKAG